MHQAKHDADSYRRVEVITGARRRRSWSEEEKARIVAESADPEANISEVARRNGVSRGLLTVWRRQARMASHDALIFAQVRIAAPCADALEPDRCAGADANEKIEIDIAGARVRVPTGTDAATLRTVIAALRFAR